MAIPARSLARQAPRFAAGRPAARLAARRPASTTAEAKKIYGNADHTHAIAGVAGGLGVVLLAYGWYHFSGTKQVVGTARDTFAQAKSLKDKAAQATPDPKAVLSFLRSTAKTYGAAIPGVGYVIDQAFDQLDSLSDKHGDEVNKLIGDAYKELTEAFDKGGDNLADKVMEVVNRTISKAQQVSGKVSTDVVNPLLDSNPRLKAIVGDGLSELQKLADSHGPQARKLYDQTQDDLKSLVDQGLNASTLAQAAHLLRSRTTQLKDLAADAGSDAWQEAQKRALPYLDKMPDLRDTLDKTLSTVKGKVGPEGSKLIESTYAELEQLGQQGVNKDSLKKAQQLVQSNVKKLTEMAKQQAADATSGSSSLLSGGAIGSVLAAVPGLDKIAPDLQGLKDLAEKKGPEAEKLLNETYSELQQVLRKRFDQGKKLAEQTAAEGKQKATK